MNVINLTPHEINIVGNEGKVLLSVAPSGVIGRADEVRTKHETLSLAGIEVPCVELDFTAANSIPDPVKGTILIVSVLTAQAARRSGRTSDIYFPTDLVRDDRGRIVGARSLAQLSTL